MRARAPSPRTFSNRVFLSFFKIFIYVYLCKCSSSSSLGRLEKKTNQDKPRQKQYREQYKVGHFLSFFENTLYQ